MSGVDELRDALKPWDGRWFGPMPDGGGVRFYSMPQFTAKQLLRRRAGLSNWAARLLQVIVAQEVPLTPTQRYWLNRIAGEQRHG